MYINVRIDLLKYIWIQYIVKRKNEMFLKVNNAVVFKTIDIYCNSHRCKLNSLFLEKLEYIIDMYMST